MYGFTTSMPIKYYYEYILGKFASAQELGLVAIQKYIMFLHFCRPREIAGDPNCSGDASTSSLLPTESRDEIDVAELQSELLVLLCPTLGKESDEVRRQSLLGNGTGNVSTGTGNSIQQSV